ncbi:hypothetical protein [Amycolatopsis nalaikhensis]|uniref:Uncharacterized protein n=1 Tax=Amycolatopsis nalaikhensis TaxID=715472 RepID=A0ABY8XUB2_9PSEU|nr:hypothetical protein [Amycolatopsis sp. 2-2]WIV59243.1 hypothetical protein QP939_11735 [Amycolatopsis sp. 2-2]
MREITTAIAAGVLIAAVAGCSSPSAAPPRLSPSIPAIPWTWLPSVRLGVTGGDLLQQRWAVAQW